MLLGSRVAVAVAKASNLTPSLEPSYVGGVALKKKGFISLYVNYTPII